MTFPTRVGACAVLAATLLGGCGDDGGGDALASRLDKIYLGQCIHAR